MDIMFLDGVIMCSLGLIGASLFLFDISKASVPYKICIAFLGLVGCLLLIIFAIYQIYAIFK